MILDGINHQEKVTESMTTPSGFSSYGTCGFRRSTDLTPQDVPVGFRSCICNAKRTSHVNYWLGIEVLRAWSRR